MTANEKATAAKATEINETITAVSSVNSLPVTRKPFIGKDKKEYWGYVVAGKVVRVKNGKRLEKEITVDFVAKDQGGYEVLDLIFFETDTAELVMYDATMTNEKTGEMSTYTVYEIQAKDDDGTVYSYKVKPSRESDKALLTMLINSLKNGGGNVDVQG